MTVQKLLRLVRSTLSLSSHPRYTLADEVALYRKRARIALQEERFLDAIVFFIKALRLDPYDLSAQIAVAEIYHYQLLEPEKALMSYEQVLAAVDGDESNPFSSMARAGIRILTSPANLSELESAEAEFEEASLTAAG